MFSSLVEQKSRVSFQKFFDVFEFVYYSVNFEIFYGMFIIIKHHNKKISKTTLSRESANCVNFRDFLF